MVTESNHPHDHGSSTCDPYTNIANLIKSKKNIVVITGAGISTSLGIPDFRSQSGVYHTIGNKEARDPQDCFDINIFKENPALFYSIASKILPTKEQYTITHEFIQLLHRNERLLTNYTQNVDGIELIAGIPSTKLVQCHGSFATASCFTCGYRTHGTEISEAIITSEIPYCPKCQARGEESVVSVRSKNRSVVSNRHKPKSLSKAVMKPDIIFFNEELPKKFYERLKEDKEVVDLVIVIGTSLEVSPVCDIPSELSHVPQIFISKEMISHTIFDFTILGECDSIATMICKRLGWDLQLLSSPSENTIPEPNPIDYDQAGDQYEVDYVVAYRIKRSKLKYWVKWKGWDDKYSSWVPSGDINKELIAKFKPVSRRNNRTG